MRQLFAFVISLLAVCTTEAQTPRATAESDFNPEKVLMSRFTFVRPPDWKWVDTRSDVSNVIQSVTFEVNYPGQPNVCRAYFNHFKPEKPAGSRKVVAKRWNDSFVNAHKAVAFGKPKTIGTNLLSYLEINGAFKPDPHATVVRSDYGLFGAIIEHPDGNIVMRLMGPSTWVKRTTADFKKMIEDALREDKPE